jgi:pimeloyl-ACP methyl ester carboxylesterase
MKKTKLTRVFLMIAILAALFIMTTTVLAEKPPEYILEDPCQGFEPMPDAQIYCGVHQGAGYRIEIPDNWNGDLLMWAHGYRMNSDTLWVDNPPFREWLVANGYAWAASSFTSTMMNVTDGMKSTKALVALFQELAGKPAYTYISGQSMGGSITVSSIEQWPNLYDGGMPTCGAVSLYETLDTHWDFYVLSNALAGSTATHPIPDDYLGVGYPVVTDNLAIAPGWFPYALNAQGIKLKDAFEILTGGQRPLYDQAFVFWYGIIEAGFGFSVTQFFMDIEAAGVQGIWTDNWETVYQLDSDPALSPEEQALNDIVFRIQRDPQALHPNGIKNIPVVTGNINVPVLSIHGIGDLLVPFSAEQIYANKVANYGASDLLVQRAIRDIVHCDFMQDEYIMAFTDLVNWVENGVKPAGDDILNPIEVTDPYFGCAFTSQDRDYSWVSPLLAIPTCP